MGDPVFTTREELEAWEETLCSRSYLDNPRHGHIPFVIQRVRAAHAHLLNQESDNGKS